MRRSEWRARERVYGYCRACGGEVYLGEACFRVGGRLLCRDCVREGREIAGETTDDWQEERLQQKRV